MNSLQTMPMSFVFFLLFTLTATPAAATTHPPPIFFPGAASRSQARAAANTQFQTRYFPQNLDHFTFTSKSYNIFYQKYLINSKFWSRPGGPIFVYTGNEGDIEWFASNTGFLLDIAPKFKALLVFIEHRYYGESLPFGKDSYSTTDTVGYLNSQQALADYALLIRSLKQNLSSESSPVVVFGGSYGGMLAAWFRLKYPHIAIGALASSAPILHFDDIVPSTSFYDAVSQDFKSASLNCYQVIKESWGELDVLSTQKTGLSQLSKSFRTCKELSSIYPARNWLWSAFVYTAMVNYPTPANFMKPLPAYPVEEMCKIIDSYPARGTNLEKAFAAAALYYNYTRTEKCFNLEKKADAHGLGGWNWQACTEMVMPMSCSSDSMFPPDTYNFKDFADNCKAMIGVTPRPHWITTEYGGKRIGLVLKRYGSNMIFSNGMQDPWSRGSVLKSISASIVALVTEKGAHHVDFRSATKDDPDWLINQRKQEVEIIQGWLDQYYADLKQEANTD
ncbi:hypothetical protein MLD38_005654 [Melastoma candidum]|uniref:Uncharacterized protein n=1 Tax=Melastoma candidum TaxID=119954 RepID=A0ACB9RKW9_9MYRT|nr:hypothetical protein MLD38_005654 [Melastoma candidum]